MEPVPNIRGGFFCVKICVYLYFYWVLIRRNCKMKNFLCSFIVLILIPQLQVSAQGIGNQSEHQDLIVGSVSMPFLVQGKQTKKFHFKGLKKSLSRKPYESTLELTSNPIWFVIQALPYIIENQNGSTIDVLNSFFANSVALYLLNKEIGVDILMQKWEKEPGNSDQAKMHQRIGQMFDTLVINKRMSEEITALEKRQQADGSWPWFPGMKESRYITQLMCCGIGRLYDMHIYDNYSDRLNNMAILAFKYCDNEMNNDYEKIVSRKEDMKANHVTSDILTYLYARTFWNAPAESKFGKAVFYWQEQAWTYWQDRSPLEKAMLVPIFYRQAEDTVYIKMLRRFESEAIHSDKDGVYWKWNVGSTAEQTATQSMLLEGYDIMRFPTPDPKTIEGMKIRLLQYRQMDHWATNIATVDAIYALLQKDNNPVVMDKLAQIIIGDDHFDSTAGQGSGYLYHVWKGDEIKAKLANFIVENKTDANAWGDVSMQYAKKTGESQTNIDGLKITKQVSFLENNSNSSKWMPLVKTKTLKTGDSLKISIELSAGKRLNYIHIQNNISLLTQLVDTTSGVRQMDGLSYERVVADGSVDFFLEHVDVQKYVFGYTLAVRGSGSFQKGNMKVEKVY